MPIDSLAFEFEVMADGDEQYDLETGPTYGCYVYGLFIDGCKFDTNSMTL